MKKPTKIDVVAVLADEPTKNLGGRPSKYEEKFLQTAKDYLLTYEVQGDAVPTIEGLADIIGVGARTLYNWADAHSEFQAEMDALLSKQGRLLQNGGLTGKFQQPTTKLLLSANHDKREKGDMTTNGDKLPVGIIYLPEKKPEGA